MFRWNEQGWCLRRMRDMSSIVTYVEDRAKGVDGVIGESIEGDGDHKRLLLVVE